MTDRSEGEVDDRTDLGTIWGGRKFDSGPDFHLRAGVPTGTSCVPGSYSDGQFCALLRPLFLESPCKSNIIAKGCQ